MRREEKEKEGKAGESEVGGGTNERGGEGEIPSAGPRFPRSNKWRMETETGAQNMAGGGGRERPSPTLIGCGRWREREAHFCIIWQQGYGKIGWGKARAPEQRGGRAGLPRGAEPSGLLLREDHRVVTLRGLIMVAICTKIFGGFHETFQK